MAECCHYRHGNAAETEIKNEFQTKLEEQVKRISPSAVTTTMLRALQYFKFQRQF